MKEDILKNLSPEEKKALLNQLQQEEKEERIGRREAYEGLRAEFLMRVKNFLVSVTDNVQGFRDWLEKESANFRTIMNDYGQLRNEAQGSYTITDGSFRLSVKSNTVKCFDERADIAAERLINYLEKFVLKTEKGTEDEMYQLAMTLLERNRQGDLDYKSICKLYQMEEKFDEEYSEIMNLFKESHIVSKTAVNYYFYQKDDKGVWRRIEPSFCRLS